MADISDKFRVHSINEMAEVEKQRVRPLVDSAAPDDPAESGPVEPASQAESEPGEPAAQNFEHFEQDLKGLVQDEVQNVLDEEIKKARQELVIEYRKAVVQIVEENKTLIRKLVEEEKKAIWDQAADMRGSLLQHLREE